ncbi:MAG: tRNA uridine-5-carboxymethylaminomethyl(34) synthesis GTPase MnmE [Gammaproteobacteria bacterium]|nr:tRNA uridine-5-carboxymethylaminomethyl(34) synthesis GTPase MnmE [Gammaproteobacteria bacterium]MCP4090887.1 tRNA uridine-5-carboxymethylaminomethyl(34) synthesis GTPase MnmE [Gammaproteobacteria bacterium]MCP4275174.1 tRNA uridine-5-carboxymethylaminomethyl(34) synthesis GTPase MnmE [Gammaproteobacteria bacterium]MCP4830816.1 tRNA uridine-5-carboxymethylaminomethyl(34) synthesis GTPase MnmE [Gammaproteobacteria bacterium]MCP4929605.1 tRNA uridine-5-carboxymethylaminomethyl(34) synthesis GT
MATFNTVDTIVARATPAGRGGVAVLRLSGVKVKAIAEHLLGTLPVPRYATFTEFTSQDDGVIDMGIALYFPAPHSFTGEDVLELQGHGSPIVTEMLIKEICLLGARIAEPGEFSRRAFLNDKIDLAQAEAIADLIDSSSQTAARAARRSLQGKFSELIVSLNEEVTALRVYVEAAMDFPEEEIDFLSDEALTKRFETVRNKFSVVEHTVQQGCLLRNGVTVVLAGRPNAGKSSLLNALAGYEAAIVTEIPGTTRDLVREQIEIHGLPVHIIDTAGLRQTADIIEEEGVRRAQHELSNADHALVIIDSSSDNEAVVNTLLGELPEGLHYTVVRNKADLSGEQIGFAGDTKNTVSISALTGAGINELREYLELTLGYQPAAEGSVTARRRHLESLRKAMAFFTRACEILYEDSAAELMAEELLQVQNELAEITGQFSSDDLLGRIFEDFCIGK